MLRFHEFFAGRGMDRAGLGKDWTCLFANGDGAVAPVVRHQAEQLFEPLIRSALVEHAAE